MSTPGPRFPDIDVGAVEVAVRRATEHLTLFPDLDDPRYLETFVGRAEAKFALGKPAREVLADLRSAALCLRGQAAVRLYKLEPHRLKTRRLDPMHLTLLHPDPDLVERAGADYGLPLANHYASAGSAALEDEVRIMSPYFAARTLRRPADIVGLAAATYAAVLGYLMAGDDGSARAVLRVLAREADSLDEPPPPAGRRYLLQCAALGDILEERGAELGDKLAALVPHVRAEREKALARSAAEVRREGRGAPDPTVPALVGLAMLVNLDPPLEPLAAADADLADLAAEVVRSWEAVE